jgi:hypothetical protein
VSTRTRLNAQSTQFVGFVYRDSGVIGLKTRVGVRFPGDADRLGRTSRGAYFRITS